MRRPAILVSAPASGQGKTLVSAALARAWRNQGFTVQAFKCGPDFIDSMILQVATGRPVYHLDLGMCGLEDGRALLYKAAHEVDVIVVEGVMGLYDGTPSTAAIAEAFDLPIALVIDASGMAQTFAAIAHGLYDFAPTSQRAGVFANKVGSEGHATMLKAALPANIPWLGALSQQERWQLPERHLGLHLADEISDLESRIADAAQHLSASLGTQLALPPQVDFDAQSTKLPPQYLAGKTIAIARDAAFCFIYPANIDCLQALGAQIIYFSLLNDALLPEADAYWLPGGYPELHLDTISNNQSMRHSLQRAAHAGKSMLAECGGMMALGEYLNGAPMFGLLAGESVIEQKLQGLGTQFLQKNTQTINAHTFHYGKFETSLTPENVAQAQFGEGEAVYKQGNITASFLHFYFPSNPAFAAQFFLS